ncbi:MAG: hypothetical protein K0S74_722 [Chlamydiales bacterium]|jgi:hypothetical protein|nr:hypothetical protein [Chlamydiales bacterium]
MKFFNVKSIIYLVLMSSVSIGCTGLKRNKITVKDDYYKNYYSSDPAQKK